MFVNRKSLKYADQCINNTSTFCGCGGTRRRVEVNGLLKTIQILLVSFPEEAGNLLSLDLQPTDDGVLFFSKALGNYALKLKGMLGLRGSEVLVVVFMSGLCSSRSMGWV